MLFRRIAEHVKAQNWTAVALDFVIVVVGVFIGLQVSNWNDGLAERRTEAAYLARLDKDFDVIRERLELSEAAFRQSVEAADLVLKARRIHRGEASGEIPDDAIIMANLLEIGGGAVPAGSSAAFQEMISSGELKLLTSEALRDALFEYDQSANVGRDIWRTLRDGFNLASLEIYELLEYEAKYNGDGTDEVVPVRFDRERLFEQGNMPGLIGTVMSLQANQRQVVARQLEFAEQVEALIAEERETQQ